LKVLEQMLEDFLFAGEGLDVFSDCECRCAKPAGNPREVCLDGGAPKEDLVEKRSRRLMEAESNTQRSCGSEESAIAKA
jgi:hypothetical protein